jgi:hypothetical protein
MVLNPIETHTFEVGPRDYLTAFLRYISTLRNGETKYVGLLHARIHELHPALANSLGFPGPPPTRSSGHSTNSPTSTHQSMGSGVTLLEGSQTSVSSPYASTPAITPGSQLSPTPLQYPITGHVPTSASERSEVGITRQMNTSQDITSPQGAVRDGVLTESMGNRPNHPYPMHYSSGPRY